MPPIFAPPSPLGTEAAIGVGAGQAAVTEKYAPLLAHIYDSISSSLANRGGGGGGGGGGGFSNYIQVLPNNDGGAMVQAQAQANREERAQDLRYEYEQDPVSKHLALQNQGRMDLLNRRLSVDPNTPQPVRQGPPPTPVLQWGREDDEAMTEASQVIAKTDKALAAMEITPETANMLRAPYQDRLAELQQKKEAVDKQNEQRQFAKAATMAAHADGLNATRTQNRANWEQTPVDEIPGMPKRHYSLDAKGEWKLDNGPERVQHQRNFATMNERADKAAVDAAKHEADMKAKAAELDDKHFHEDRAAAAKELETKSITGEVVKPTHEQITERAEKIAEARRKRRGGKNDPGMAQPHADDTQPKAPSSEQEKAMQRLNAILTPMAHTMPPVRPRPEVTPEAIPAQQLSPAYGNYQGVGRGA